MTSATWALETARDDLSVTWLIDLPLDEPGEGEAVLRVDRVGLTANNVTYAVLGESFRYWQFFPASTPERGRVPLWGFAEVVASAVDGVEVGSRVYGYLPPAGHLLVRPERVDRHGFRDGSAHRAELPSPYNAYALTTGDGVYEPEREDLQVLFRALFFTSFLLADQMTDGGAQGASRLVLSSASSKTAYGTAFLLRGADTEVVGLTSAGNVEFTTSLGCYDRVLSYDEVDQLGADVPTGYLDLSGSTPLRRSLHERLGSALVLDLVVGVTHQDASPAGVLSGTRTTGFFAPERMRTRTGDWGRDGLDARYGDAWRSFASTVEGWVDVTVSSGPEGLRDVWLEVLGGGGDPRTGHVVQL